MDESVLKWEMERLWQAGTHIMGRVLYEIMASYLPTSKETPAMPMNQIPKVVFSKSLKQATWGPAEIVSGYLAEEITRLKQRSRKTSLLTAARPLLNPLPGLTL